MLKSFWAIEFIWIMNIANIQIQNRKEIENVNFEISETFIARNNKKFNLVYQYFSVVTKNSEKESVT